MIENSASIFFYQVCPVCEENLGKDAIMQFTHSNSNSRKVHMLYLSQMFCVLKYNLALVFMSVTFLTGITVLIYMKCGVKIKIQYNIRP